MANISHYYPKLQLFLNCRKLPDVEVFSKTDPTVEVLEKNTREGQWISLGQTEVIWDNLNPDFIKYFVLDFHFEEQRFLKFKVWNANDKNGTLQNADFIGEAECTVGEIVGASGQQLIRTLRLPGSRESRGNIILRTEEMAQSKERVFLRIQGSSIKDISGMFRKFKPFFYLIRSMENGVDQKVYVSPHLLGRDPDWPQFDLSLAELAGNDMNRPLTLEVYDHHSNGSHKFVGITGFTLQSATEGGTRDLVLADSKHSRKNYGTIRIRELNIVNVPSFLDYIAGGCQLNLLVAIDFTMSNGSPQRRDSMHYLDPAGQNNYEKALFSVGEILLNYDSDKLVPMYGFGGKIYGQVNHCFNINFNPQDPNVCGLDGMMMAYRNSLMNVELSGPTLFSHVIQSVVLEAESAHISQSNQQYFILLILTDGEIHDMKETIDWIVRGSRTPLSIVIVGIGNEDFTHMNILDADDVPLIDSRGKQMERDIVQFVPFRDVGNSPTALAREVLDEIPREIVNFFSKSGIVPNPHVQFVDQGPLSRANTMTLPPQQGTQGVPPMQGNYPVPPPMQGTSTVPPSMPYPTPDSYNLYSQPPQMRSFPGNLSAGQDLINQQLNNQRNQ